MVLRSRQTVHVVDLVSEGEIEGLVNGLQSVYLNNIPVKSPEGNINHRDVQVTARYGTPDQPHMPSMGGVESEHSLSAEVLQATPVSTTITDNEVDSARVTMSINQLYSQGKKGPYNRSVAFKIETHNGDGVWDLAGNKTGKTYDGITIGANSSNIITIDAAVLTKGLDFYYAWYNPSTSASTPITYTNVWLQNFYTSQGYSTTRKVLEGTAPNYLIEYKTQAAGSWTTATSGTFPTVPTDGSNTYYAYAIKISEADLPSEAYNIRLTTTGGAGVCYVGGDTELNTLFKTESGDSSWDTTPLYRVISTIGLATEGGDLNLGTGDTNFNEYNIT